MKALLQTLGARWATLASRERMALITVATVLGTVAIWFILLAPALNTLKKTDAQHRQLDLQLQKMRALQAAAQALQSQPKSSREDAVRAIERTLKPLGAGAQMQVSGDRLTLTLKQIPAPVLADWLVQSRAQSRMQASEVRLTRNPRAPAAAWDGTLIFSLPPG